MSDTFANEFEKWLENKSEKETERLSNDGSDDGSECAMNVTHSDEYDTEEEKAHKYLQSKHSNKIASGVIFDQAPVLLDDEEEDGVDLAETQKYEDEPPVLEPILKQTCQLSALKHQKFSPQICLRTYSRHKAHSSTEEDNVDNTEIINHKNISSITCKESNYHKLKKKHIFDQVSTESYGHPPTLIPTPEAVDHQLTAVEKKPNQSPNFCAMEADSTSEITGGKIKSVFRTRKLSKNSVHGDVLIECDSTCMLAVSPLIVSPASLSNGDTEEAKDSMESKETNMENSSSGYKEFDNSVENPEDSQVSFKKNLAGHSLDEAYNADCINKDSILDVVIKTEYMDKDVITRPIVHNLYQAFDDSSSSDAKNVFSDPPSQPPVLSAMRPSPRSRRRSRRKRHTIDSPETLSRSRKRTYAITSRQTHPEELVTPTFSQVSDTVSTRSKQAKIIPQISDKPNLNCLLVNTSVCKLQHRRHTHPLPDSETSSHHLSEDLHTFVVNTKALSHLQVHMHRLLCQLFPRLKSDLESMSPESSHFESILCDLVSSLELPENPVKALQRSTSPSFPLCRDNNSALHDQSEKSISLNSQSSLNSEKMPNRVFPSLFSCDSQAANNIAKYTNSEAVSSQITSTLSSVKQQQENQQGSSHPSQDQDSDLIIPQLSGLTLKDMEDNLEQTRVVLCKDPGEVLHRFAGLSCKVLQLLLPDLADRLNPELSESPSCLTAFVNEVIFMNSRRRSRHLHE